MTYFPQEPLSPDEAAQNFKRVADGSVPVILNIIGNDNITAARLDREYGDDFLSVMCVCLYQVWKTLKQEIAKVLSCVFWHQPNTTTVKLSLM